MGRLVLPLLGGSPGVWITCVAYYQVLLLAGYAWAHLVVSRVSLRRQVVLQSALLAASMALQVPLALRAQEPAASSVPAVWLIGGLSASLGLTFLALATTAPLLQAWLFRAAPGARDPYPLYRASNAGSALALLAYPALVEPWLTLGQQRLVWSLFYGVYVLLVAAVAAGVWRACGSADGTPVPSAGEPGARSETISSSRIARWLFLAAVPSSLMLGVTTFVTAEVASVPLLWVLPLLAYLVSFIVTFSPSPVVPHRLAARLLPASLLAVLVADVAALRSPWWLIASLHLVNLLLAALVCHGELARSRPRAERLTGFYLSLAAGGAAGGLFNSVIAPAVFGDVLEYPIALVAAGAALPFASSGDATPADVKRERLYDIELPIGAGALAVLLILFTREFQVSKWVGALVTLGLPAACVFRFRRRPLRFALGLTALLLAAWLAVPVDGRVLFADRSFFGVLRVTTDASGRAHAFYHGSTLHGRQDMAPPFRREPLTYYHRGGPVDDVVRAFPGGIREAGVAGLGTGTMAAYGRGGERWTFFEIDPMVAQVARDPSLFTFLRDARAEVAVVLGDARLALGRVADASYDLLVLDAFSSDAVPVHLLTDEALELYLRKLRPEGLLVFNVSNRYVDLAPLLGVLGKQQRLVVIARDDRIDAQTRRRGWLSSHWVAMGREGSPPLALLRAMAGWRPVSPAGRAWTDDYASLVSVLRLR